MKIVNIFSDQNISLLKIYPDEKFLLLKVFIPFTKNL